MRARSPSLIKDELNMAYEGWKLVLSVKPNQVKEAIDLVFPITDYYNCCHHWLFSSNPQSQNPISLKRVGLLISRFTSPEIYLNPNDAVKMVEEITDVLKSNGILPGTILSMYAQTFSPYFGLRNENWSLPFSYPQLEDKAYRKQIEQSSSYFNLMNAPNPYVDLLEDIPAFDLFYHFILLPVKTKQDVLMNFKITLYAYLREHTLIDTWSENDSLTFTQECFSLDKKLDPKWIKPLSASKMQMKDIKAAMILFEWTFYPQAEWIALPTEGADLPCSPDLIDLLKFYNQTLDSTPAETMISVVSPLLFTEFLQDKREKLAENWVNYQCELVKDMVESSLHDVLAQIIKHNDYYRARAAIKQLKNRVDIHDYHHLLLTLDKHALVQIELAELFINEYRQLGYERPLTYKGIMYLKQAVAGNQNEGEIEWEIAEKVNSIWISLQNQDSYQAKGFWNMSQRGSDMLINALKELVRIECRLAQFLTASFMCSDLNVHAMHGHALRIKSSYQPNHEQAKCYFQQVIADETVSAKIRLYSNYYLSELSLIQHHEKTCMM